MPLPINVEDLLGGTLVESARLECKEGWNPEAVMHTMCAFANDLHNWGGGYLLVGVGEINGKPQLPPTGLTPELADRIQKELVNLSNQISPKYFPVVEPVTVDSRLIVVIWAPGGQNRPYKAPNSLGKKETGSSYYVRVNSSTVRAKDVLEQELLQLTASVPFDDRVNHRATLQDLQLRLIQAHLQEVGSDLFNMLSTMSMPDICAQLRISDGPQESPRPRNVGLMFFNDHPERWFDSAWIDVVYFPDGHEGREIQEKRFSGPLSHQLRDAAAYIRERFIEGHVTKHDHRAESDRYVSYPFAAVEEALANAVFHRDYSLRDPIEVQVTPAAITITSYPGPDASVSNEALRKGHVVSRRYRNRRIGEFLKELHLTEGRGTGLPTIRRAMAENGSPAPTFETDEGRTYFTTTLPIHPALAPKQENARKPTLAGTEGGDDDSMKPSGGIPETLTADPRVQAILRFCREPRGAKDIMKHVGMSSAYHFRTVYLKPMLEAGLLRYTRPESPRAKNQAYLTTPHGETAVRETP